MAALALGLQGLEHGHLVRVRLEVEAERWNGRPVASALCRERLCDAIAIALRVVGLELVRIPVRLEGGPELLEERRRVPLRQADIPLEALVQRRAREVRRADVRGMRPGVAVEEPGLRVKACAPDVVGNADLGAGARELVDGAFVARPDVCGREDPERQSSALGARP